MRIVVGADGSAGSVPALRWAWREALAHGGSVDAVSTWEHPLLAVLPPVGEQRYLDARTARLEEIVRQQFSDIESERGGRRSCDGDRDGRTACAGAAHSGRGC